MLSSFRRNEEPRYRESGATKCPCDVRQGTKRDAILYACGANAAHGQRRKREDVQRAIRTLLKDSEWRGWTDVKIAKQCHATDKTVATIRTEMAASSEIPMIEGPRKAIRNGKEYTIDTSNIGKTKPTEKAEAKQLDAKQLFEMAEQGRVLAAEREAVAKEKTPYQLAEERAILDGKEAVETFRIAETAIATLWNKCPESYLYELKAKIEKHLSRLYSEHAQSKRPS